MSGGLSAGLLYGAVFVALQGVLAKVGDDFTAFHGWSVWLVQFTALLPALIGIGLGRNPSGFLSDFFAQYGPMIRKVKPVLFAGVGRRAVVVVPRVHAHDQQLGVRARLDRARRRAPAHRGCRSIPRRSGVDRREQDDGDATPLELIGIDRPFTADDLREIDRGIGLGVPT